MVRRKSWREARAEAAKDKADMERALPLGSQWRKEIAGRAFGIRFDGDGLTEWLADEPSQTWRGRWALTPGDDMGGIETLRLETQIGDCYSRLLWRENLLQFHGKEFTLRGWESLGLVERAKGYYYGFDSYPSVILTRDSANPGAAGLWLDL